MAGGRIRKRLMPVVSLLTGIIATIVILFLLVMHTDFFARSTGRMLSRYLFRGTDFVLRIEKLRGNPAEDMTIEGLTIRYRGEDFSFDVLRIERLHLRYSLPSLMRKSIRVEELTVERPHLWVKPDSSGAYILPGAGGAGGGALPPVEISRFTIEGGQVIVQGVERADAMRNINISGSLAIEGYEAHVRIAEGSAEDIARDMSIHALSGGVRVVRERPSDDGGGGSRIFLDELSIALDKSHFTANGYVAPDSLHYRVKVLAEPLDIAELLHLFKIETSHYGELQGDFIARDEAEKIGVVGVFTGIFSGYALDQLEVDMLVEQSRISIRRCSGSFNDARVDGSGYYTFGTPELLHFDLEIERMNLSKRFIPDTTVPETDFSGGFIFDYNLTDERLSFEFDLGPGHFREFPFSRASIAGSYGGGTLSLDDVLLVHPTHTIRTHGTVSGADAVQLYFDLDCARSDTLFPYFGIEDYRADVVMNGIWEGSFDRWELRASGACSNFVYHAATVPSGEVKLAVEMGDDLSVFVDLVGSGCDVDPVRFSGVDLSLAYDAGVTTINRLHLPHDDIDIEMRGETAERDDGTALVMRDLSIDALGERWTGGGGSAIVFGDSTVRFEDVQLHARRGAVYLDGTLNRVLRRIEGGVSFERVGIELINNVGLVSTPFAGTANGRIAVDGDLADPGVDIFARITGGAIDTIAVDTLTFGLRYEDRRYTLDSLVVASPLGFIDARGTVIGPRLADLAGDRERALHDAMVRLETECRRLSLAPFLPLVAWAPISSGIFTGRITVDDTLSHPDIGINGGVEGLAVGPFVLPAAEIEARIGAAGLFFEGSVGLTAMTKGGFGGRIPLTRKHWLYAPDERLPMSLEVDLAGGRLGELTGLTDWIAEGDGVFSAEFRVGGTTARPDIIGELKLTDASFRFAGMEERFYDVDARILLKDTLITLDGLRGREGRNGSFNCGGTISLKGWRPYRYDLTADLDKFLLASIPEVMAILSGRIAVGTRPTDRGPVPFVSGDLEVNKAEVYYDLGDFARAEKTTTLETPTWLLEVDLKVPGNTWLKTPDANVEMRGDITLHHNRRGTYLRGDLYLVRGWYDVYGNRFRVRSGELDFVHAASFRPVVNIEAETRDPEGRKIFLDLVWLQDDIEPRLSLYHEDPGYSETDIWKMLGGGVFGSPSGAEGGDWDALGTAQSLAANYIEKILNTQMEGVTIEVTSGASGMSNGTVDTKETMVAIGKYLSEGLYVQFRQGLSISSAREIEVEYRISDHVILRSEIIKYSEKVLQGKSLRSGDEVNLDIKLRWEF